MYTQRDFEMIKDLVVKGIPSVVSIILFGSYANGTAQEDSDLDFIILTEAPIERHEKLQLLASLRWEAAHRGYNVDFLLKTEKDFLLKRKLPTLSKVIFNEGKLVWKKS